MIINNDLLKKFEIELVFCDIETANYNNLSNAIMVIKKIDSSLFKFNLNNIINLLEQLKSYDIYDEQLNEYISKIYKYIDNQTINYYYNIYKFKQRNIILEKKLSSLSFTQHLDEELGIYEKNNDYIYKLINEIDFLLYESNFKKDDIESKLNILLKLNHDEEVIRYIQKVKKYISLDDKVSNEEKINLYKNIYKLKQYNIII